MARRGSDINKLVDDYTGTIAELAAVIGVSVDRAVDLFSQIGVDLRKNLTYEQLGKLAAEVKSKKRVVTCNGKPVWSREHRINQYVDQIMELIRHRPMGAADIERAIGYENRNVVRGKMELMERLGLVERVKTNLKGRNGRPALLWRAKDERH